MPGESDGLSVNGGQWLEDEMANLDSRLDHKFLAVSSQGVVDVSLGSQRDLKEGVDTFYYILSIN